MDRRPHRPPAGRSQSLNPTFFPAPAAPPPRATWGNKPSRSHSLPVRPADVYRTAMAMTGPPPKIPFQRQYDAYKSSQKGSEKARTEYKDYLRTAPPVSRKVRTANPGVYQGAPPATKGWHEGAASKAGTASSAFGRVAGQREQMGRDYVGYDSYKSSKGHREAAKTARDSETAYLKKKSTHSKSHK